MQNRHLQRRRRLAGQGESRRPPPSLTARRARWRLCFWTDLDSAVPPEPGRSYSRRAAATAWARGHWCSKVPARRRTRVAGARSLPVSRRGHRRLHVLACRVAGRRVLQDSVECLRPRSRPWRLRTACRFARAPALSGSRVSWVRAETSRTDASVNYGGSGHTVRGRSGSSDSGSSASTRECRVNVDRGEFVSGPLVSRARSCSCWPLPAARRGHARTAPAGVRSLGSLGVDVVSRAGPSLDRGTGGGRGSGTRPRAASGAGAVRVRLTGRVREEAVICDAVRVGLQGSDASLSERRAQGSDTRPEDVTDCTSTPTSRQKRWV